MKGREAPFSPRAITSTQALDVCVVIHFHGHNITWQLMYPYERCFPARYFQSGNNPPDRNIFEFDRKKLMHSM